ncbi:MAG: hypothetical protein V3T70_06215 [Phycisphaerae bacterium]
MSIKDRLFKPPTAAQLSESLDALARECAALACETEQSEATCVACSSDDTAYRDAATQAEACKRQLGAARERLARMQIAHTEAVNLERDAELDQLKAKHERLLRDHDATCQRVRAEREAEKRRHADSMLAFHNELNRSALVLKEMSDQIAGLKDAIDAEVASSRSARAEANGYEIRKLTAQLTALGHEGHEGRRDLWQLRAPILERLYELGASTEVIPPDSRSLWASMGFHMTETQRQCERTVA